MSINEDNRIKNENKIENKKIMKKENSNKGRKPKKDLQRII